MWKWLALVAWMVGTWCWSTGNWCSGQVVNDFGQPFTFRYLSFENDRTRVENGVARIMANNGQGGAGTMLHLDLGAFADHTPVLHVRVLPGNRARALRLILEDAHKTSSTPEGQHRREFMYDLTKVPVDAAEFTPVTPKGARPLSPKTLEEPDQTFDPGQIRMQQLSGDWQSAAVQVEVDRVVLQPVSAALKEEQAKMAAATRAEAERRQQEAEARQRQRAEILARGAAHPQDGPRVARVAVVAPDVLAVYLDEGTIVAGRQEPYVPQPGDEIREKDQKPYLARVKGQVRMAGERSLHRREGQQMRELGLLVDDDRTLVVRSRFVGTRLTTLAADAPESYRITSRDDPRYSQVVSPVAVHRKSVPGPTYDGGPLVRHVLYLRLPHPLTEGASYEIGFHGINTAEASVSYTHAPTKVRSEAVRVSHVGFTPDSPFKRAFLSVWLGDGGAMSYAVDSFEIRDVATGQTHFRGPVKLGIAAEKAETLDGGVNRNGTPVYFLDFHEFSREGEYVVYVPGVGVSYTFRIAADVWEAPLRLSMHGLMVHRSGLALAPPYADYARPRPMHPEDGVVVYQTDVTMWEGESEAIRASLTRLLGPSLDDSKLERLPFAWGGYMDAGDWDRRAQHLEPTLVMMEAFEQYPQALEALNLPQPPDEAANGIPAYLNEVLWNVNFYRRLQRPEGGVRGGIESTEHPRNGETSWQESLLIGAFEVDPASTYRYAAAAARASRVVAKFDEKLAGELRESALRAWAWASEHGAASVASVESRNAGAASRLRSALPALRALAAVELLRLTSDKSFHDAFVASSRLTQGGDIGSEMHGIYAYATLPDGLADREIKARAIAAIRSAADASLAFQQGNAYGIAMRVNLPMMGWVGYFTTPETAIGPVLTRAYVLTGDRKYLAGAVSAAQYTLGANPMNLAMTTGLGHASPQGVLHVDSRHTGQPPPRGITLYGNTKPSSAPNWVNQWFLSPHLHPAVGGWPAAEFYIDLGNWPEMNEYTIHQSIGPAAYYWAFLYGASGR